MLLSKATYNKCICHKRETTTYRCRWSKRNIETSPHLRIVTAICQRLKCVSANDTNIQVHTIFLLWGGGGRDSVMLCGVKEV